MLVKVIRGLLVVCILAIIFGLLFPQSGVQKSNARRAEAGNTVRNIVHALKAYYSDYGHFPEIVDPLPNGRKLICVGDPACKISAGSNRLVLDVLRAIPRGPNANHALNPKQEKYLEARIAKDPKAPRDGFADGPEFSAADQGCLFDPYGHQYCILFTTDGSSTLDLSAVYSDLARPKYLIPNSVAVFSLGKDGILGGKGYEGKLHKPSSNEAPDDIVSWE